MNNVPQAPNIGTGFYLPENILTNDDLERRNIVLPSGRQLLAERIKEKIGVERRHIAGVSETAADMAYKALKDIVKTGEKVDAVFASTSHPTNYHLATEIAKRSGIKNSEVLDFHAACSGTALIFSHLFENNEKYLNKNVIAAAADKFSNTLVDLTRLDAMKLDSSLGQTIFGDGAAAVKFVYGKDISVLSALNKQLPDPGGKTDIIFMGVGENKFVEPCIVKPVARGEVSRDFPDGFFTQNGPRVFEVVYKYVPDLMREAVAMAGLKNSDIDLAVIHPGSKRVVEAIRDSLKTDFEVYSDYEDGNMSSVSLLYSFIKALREKKIGRGSKVVLCGFGAGSPHLYSSTVVLEL